MPTVTSDPQDMSPGSTDCPVVLKEPQYPQFPFVWKEPSMERQMGSDFWLCPREWHLGASTFFPV